MFLPDTDSFLLVRRSIVRSSSSDFLPPHQNVTSVDPATIDGGDLDSWTNGKTTRKVLNSNVASAKPLRGRRLPNKNSFLLVRSEILEPVTQSSVQGSDAIPSQSETEIPISVPVSYLSDSDQAKVGGAASARPLRRSRRLPNKNSFLLVRSEVLKSIIQSSIQESVANLSQSEVGIPTTASGSYSSDPGQAAVGDKNKRIFLKAAGIAGVGLVATLFGPKKAHALIMGSSPTTGVVGVKNAANTRINPATEETVSTLLKPSDLTFDAGSLQVKVTSLPAGGSSFSDSGNVDKKGLVDADRHMQVDVLSSALPTSASTETTLQTISFGGFKFTLHLATVGNVDYVGEAAIGTLTSSASWRVKKIDSTTGTIIQWAGSGTFDQVWDNYASLSYS